MGPGHRDFEELAEYLGGGAPEKYLGLLSFDESILFCRGTKVSGDAGFVSMHVYIAVSCTQIYAVFTFMVLKLHVFCSTQ